MSEYYPHDINQANDYACEALERMHKEELPLTPNNFELWYVYYSKMNQELIRALDTIHHNNGEIKDQDCLEIYERFLSDERNEQAVKQAGEQINATIEGVTEAVKGVKEATNTYNETLTKTTEKIQGVENVDDVRSILSEVSNGTAQMIQYNEKLEEQLDRSSLIIHELQKDLESVRREAMTDGLTGLSNRKAFDDAIVKMKEETDKESLRLTLLMLDIDHFKSFNDNYGHQVGDQVLRLVARTLTDGVKGKDMPARYGGEEFAILLPQTALAAGITVGNALRKAVATKDIINRSTGDKMGRITMSVGVAEYQPGETIEDLISRADAALYTAKHNGRNQVAAAPQSVD